MHLQKAFFNNISVGNYGLYGKLKESKKLTN